jgi:hypothetical protein
VVNNDVPELTEEGTGKPVNDGVLELTGDGVPELTGEGPGKPANDVPGLGAGEAAGVAGVGDCVTGALAMPVAVGAAGET